ncbi:MAG: tetratricopeptide repeat protein [Phycisphaerae bacterium]
MLRNPPVVLAILAAAFLIGCGSRAYLPEQMPAGTAAATQDAAAETQPAPAHVTAQNIEYFNHAVELTSKREYVRAAEAFADLLQRFQKTQNRQYLPQTLFWLGFTYEKLGKEQQARAAYLRLLEEFPESEAAGHARRRFLPLRQEQSGRQETNRL